MDTLTQHSVGTAHGKIILIGEHSVVYHMPAIALPFTAATVSAKITPHLGESYIQSRYYSGPLSQATPLKNLVQMIYAICSYLDITYDGMHILITSSIPAQRGMGSSAAVASAITRAIFQYADCPLTDEQLIHFVSIAEDIAHGNPSGVDTHVVSIGEPVVFTKGEDPKPLPLNLNGYLITADTGIKGSTKEAVSDVAQLMTHSKNKTHQSIKTLGSLAHKAKEAISSGSLTHLGQILTSAHLQLKQLTVSSPELDELVATALQSGALGAKLTGGGRGGCMIALADNQSQAQKISEALKKSGATHTWIHSLGESTYDITP